MAGLAPRRACTVAWKSSETDNSNNHLSIHASDGSRSRVWMSAKSDCAHPSNHAQQAMQRKFGSKLAREEHFPSTYHFPISKRLTASAILSPTHACAISQVSVKGGVQSSCLLHGGRVCYINAKAQTQSRYYAFRDSTMERSAQRVSWLGAHDIGLS